MSLEFCVALMLILLGTLNLRATMRAVRVASEEHHDIPISTAITFILTHMDTLPMPMVTRRTMCLRRNSTSVLAA